MRRHKEVSVAVKVCVNLITFAEDKMIMKLVYS